jgi:putative (di)nucleoside polyphosphate hydrolase
MMFDTLVIGTGNRIRPAAGWGNRERDARSRRTAACLCPEIAVQSSSQMFRASVGIILVNDRGEVLALERADFPGQWQMPQGGIKAREEPIEAARRELYEETGVESPKARFIAECAQWMAYELPSENWSKKKGRGQVQKWFLFRFSSADRDIVLDRHRKPEFRAWRWMKLEQLADITVTFRREIYQELTRAFADYIS